MFSVSLNFQNIPRIKKSKTTKESLTRLILILSGEYCASLKPNLKYAVMNFKLYFAIVKTFEFM